MVDKEALANSYLVSGQAYAMGGIHGFIHVRDELLHFRGGNLGFFHRLGGFVKHGLAVDNDGANSHALQFRHEPLV